jgi:mono/diheme cytochrome c family protein
VLIVLQTVIGYALADDGDELALAVTSSPPQENSEPDLEPGLEPGLEPDHASPPDSKATPKLIAPAPPPEEPQPSPPRTSKPRKRHASSARSRGKSIFKKRCAACHGMNGRGDTKLGKRFKIPSLASSHASTWKINRVIKHGVPKSKMRAYKQKLNARELDAVTAFVKRFQS